MTKPEELQQQTAISPLQTPAEDAGFKARRLPGTPAGEAKGMLPGMAMIGVYMLMLALLNAFAAIHGSFGIGAARYGLLGVSTILVIGVFGFLRLLIRALFSLLFFLYLIRAEVRDRLR